MANKKKNSNYENRESKNKIIEPDKQKEYVKLFLFLVGWLILTGGIYLVFVQIKSEFLMTVIMAVYLALGLILFFAWLIFNGGFKKPNLENYEKPVEMGYDEFQNFIDKLKERQRKAKYILILCIPFPIILMLDYTIIVWGEKIFK